MSIEIYYKTCIHWVGLKKLIVINCKCNSETIMIVIFNERGNVEIVRNS